MLEVIHKLYLQKIGVGTNIGMDYWNGTLDWTTGLSYFYSTFSKKLGKNFNCNKDNICLLQYLQQCQELYYSGLIIRVIYVCVRVQLVQHVSP